MFLERLFRWLFAIGEVCFGALGPLTLDNDRYGTLVPTGRAYVQHRLGNRDQFSLNAVGVRVRGRDSTVVFAQNFRRPDHNGNIWRRPGGLGVLLAWEGGHLLGETGGDAFLVGFDGASKPWWIALTH